MSNPLGNKYDCHVCTYVTMKIPALVMGIFLGVVACFSISIHNLIFSCSNSMHLEFASDIFDAPAIRVENESLVTYIWYTHNVIYVFENMTHRIYYTSCSFRFSSCSTFLAISLDCSKVLSHIYDDVITSRYTLLAITHQIWKFCFKLLTTGF